ncbi:Holliday junction resolvase RuvX [Candidatus Omnitrophota bacterium]
MSRILGIDLGEKRIGVALSDETQTIASGLTTINVKSKADSFQKISDLVSEHGVKEVVVGLPLNMDGTHGPSAKKALRFGNELKKGLCVLVFHFDERLTTKQGEALMIKADISRGKRKLSIDKIAASIMLQSYLDYKKLKKE